MKMNQILNKLKNLNLPKMNKKLSKNGVINIVAMVLLVLAHIAILLVVQQSWRYYSIYPSLFGSAVAIVLCFLAIVDIVFFIGFNHKDLVLRIISAVLAIFLLIGGTVGTYYLRRVNSTVDNILDDGKSEKYELFSGAIVYYDEANKFKKLSDLAGKRIGMLAETSNGVSYLATEELNKEKIDYAVINYKTNTELMTALIDKKVDAIAITSAYKTIYGNDENSAFLEYLDHLVELHTFEKEMKVDTNRSQKNISKEPFNVLLIGYSRTDIGSPVGLADSIILTTINPQTYTVSMMSIARDSFVPIPCYGGERDKINSGRSTSRACFVETVKEFVDMDIDYYMELDYLGLVAIVNAIGGIKINNPVAFELDGIYVPAGEGVFADGQMALQFCRERHHMPGGDFDRQQHQKEVIIEIAKKFIRSGDINLALNAMDAASDWMSTDMTLAQLTNIFNLLLNTKNYTGMETFSLVDFQNSRMTGNGGLLYYSMSMRLPLWVYLIYQGSYDESIQHVKDVMGEFKTVNQTKNFEFSVHYPYARPGFTSDNYDNKYMFTPDPMPPYWATLSGLTQSEAQAWAAANGAKIVFNVVNFGEPGYDESMEGRIVSQSVRYGALVSEYPSATVTIMGPKEIDPSKMVPNFVGSNYKDARDWARTYGVPYDIDFDTSVSGEVGKVVSQSESPYTLIENISGRITFVVKAGTQEIKFDSNGHGQAPNSITVITGDDAKSFPDMNPTIVNGDKFIGWFTEKENGKGTRVYSTADVTGNVTVYAHWGCAEHKWKITTPATCDKDGEQVCEKCGEKQAIAKTGHKWVDGNITEQPTCTEPGKRMQTCQNDSSHTREVEVAALGHTWSGWVVTTPAAVGTPGVETNTCSVCGATETREIPALEPENTDSGQGG